MSALVLAALLAGTAAAAPDAVAAPIVTSVRIEGDAADQARLGRYVEIKPGLPLDPELVRHVVIEAHWSYRRFVQDGIENCGRGVALKRQNACRHFVKHSSR